MRGWMRAICWVGFVLWWGGNPARAQVPEEHYRERQTLDPESDEWRDTPMEATSQPAGELDEARSLLAQGEARKARKRLEDWVEANPDHERYLEAVFLLGEARFAEGNYYKAYERFEEVAENSAGETFYRALRREMDCARAFLSGEKRIFWGFVRLPAYDDGIEILDRVWERGPGTRIGEEALKLKADYFYANGDMELAQDEYMNLAREYPNGRYVRSATLRSAEASAAAFPGIKFDDKDLRDAEARYEQVARAFPEYAERENVDTRLEGIRQQRADKDLYVAEWYEKTKQPGAAEFYYRLILKDWPETLAASEAKARLRALGVEVPDEEMGT